MSELMQIDLQQLSYTNPENYTRDGFTGRFTAIEYCLAVLPEFSAWVHTAALAS